MIIQTEIVAYLEQIEQPLSVIEVNVEGFQDCIILRRGTGDVIISFDELRELYIKRNQ